MNLVTCSPGQPLTGQAVIAMLTDGTVADGQAASGRAGALTPGQLRDALQARGIVLGTKRAASDGPDPGAEVHVLQLQGKGPPHWVVLDGGVVLDPWLAEGVALETYGEPVAAFYGVRWADGTERGAARPPPREAGGDFGDAGGEGLAVRGSAAVWVDVRALVPWSGNYNEHPREQLDAMHASIDRFGWTEPILVHRGSGRIIGGHGRRLVALEKIARNPGWRLADAPEAGFVPMRWSDVSASEAEALAIADNEIATLRVRNDVQLGRVLEGIRVRDGDLVSSIAAVGLRADDVVRLLQRQAPKDPAKVEAPPPPAKPPRPVSKPGEVYELGRHRLRCGESLDAEAIRELLDDAPADLCFMDPPYAIYGSSTGVGADIADDGMVRAFFRDVLLHASGSLRLFGLVWVCCDWRSWASWWEVAKVTDLRIKNALVWDKKGAGLGSQYAQTYEMIGFLQKAPQEKALMSSRTTGARMVHAPNVFHRAAGEEAEPREEAEPADGLYDGRNLIQANRVSKGRVHNAQKPVELICDVLRPAMRPGEIVLDLFGGSGSTMIAAEKLGLQARLSERDPGYCDVIRKRWGDFARECGIDAGPGAL